MKYWSELSNSQQNIYLEFYAPKRGLTSIVPDDDTKISYGTYTPSELHVQAVTFRGSILQTLNITLNQGQRNAIIDWLEENNPRQENLIYN